MSAVSQGSVHTVTHLRIFSAAGRVFVSRQVHISVLSSNCWHTAISICCDNVIFSSQRHYTWLYTCWWV